jgi:pimeloyl-ACP methyl ester carboxylesterase
MPFAQLAEYKLHYTCHPSDQINYSYPTAIFLHGFTLDHRMWRAQSALATQFGNKRNIVVLDALGHGKSDVPETGYSRAHRIEDVRQFADALGIDRFHLVGHSMGGATAIGFALKYPQRLLSMTLICSGAAGYSPGKWVDHVFDMAKTDTEAAKQNWITNSLKFFSSPEGETIRSAMETMMTEHSGAFWRDNMRGKYPPVRPDLELVHGITVPTLILIGEYDKKFVPLAEQMHEKIAGSRLKIYENCGHMLPMEKPERCNQDLGDFWTEIE